MLTGARFRGGHEAGKDQQGSVGLRKCNHGPRARHQRPAVVDHSNAIARPRCPGRCFRQHLGIPAGCSGCCSRSTNPWLASSAGKAVGFAGAWRLAAWCSRANFHPPVTLLARHQYPPGAALLHASGRRLVGSAAGSSMNALRRRNRSSARPQRRGHRHRQGAWY